MHPYIWGVCVGKNWSENSVKVAGENVTQFNDLTEIKQITKLNPLITAIIKISETVHWKNNELIINLN